MARENSQFVIFSENWIFGPMNFAKRCSYLDLKLQLLPKNAHIGILSKSSFWTKIRLLTYSAHIKSGFLMRLTSQMHLVICFCKSKKDKHILAHFWRENSNAWIVLKEPKQKRSVSYIILQISSFAYTPYLAMRHNGHEDPIQTRFMGTFFKKVLL